MEAGVAVAEARTHPGTEEAAGVAVAEAEARTHPGTKPSLSRSLSASVFLCGCIINGRFGRIFVANHVFKMQNSDRVVLHCLHQMSDAKAVKKRRNGGDGGGGVAKARRLDDKKEKAKEKKEDGEACMTEKDWCWMLKVPQKRKLRDWSVELKLTVPYAAYPGESLNEYWERNRSFVDGDKQVSSELKKILNDHRLLLRKQGQAAAKTTKVRPHLISQASADFFVRCFV